MVSYFVCLFWLGFIVVVRGRFWFSDWFLVFFYSFLGVVFIWRVGSEFFGFVRCRLDRGFGALGIYISKMGGVVRVIFV